ncbi:MAG: PilZ domain-containing protein [Kofleriaceae bacterium]|nr:PilZ domain-containing protein [Kofleriaceae bacterium]
MEVFFVVDQPRQRLSHWMQALGPLDDQRAPEIECVDAYYEPTTDQALLGVRYDEAALGREGLAFLMEIALLSEIGMIQPAQLSDGDRRRFLLDRIARCSIHVSDRRGVVFALTELVKQLRELRSGLHKPQALGNIAARGLPRPTTAEPVLLAPAKGTRNLPPAPPPVPTAKSTRDFVAGPAAKPPAPPPLPARRAGSPTLKQTAEYAARAVAAPDSGKYGTLAGPTPPGIIYARYLRSGRWVPLRIGALSLRGAALMSGALPRVNDHVDVALSYGTHRALVRGNVGKVSSVQEATMSGTATFSVSFQLDDASRRQLTALLTAARAANVTIKPPPPRAARRFPVEWPVCLGTTRGAVRGDALDVSRDGMFVHPVHALSLGTTIHFSSVLDDGEAPVSGRCKVVRHITEAEARTAGLSPGFGLNILDMSEADRQRWNRFLARIEKRAALRVLVGANPSRLTAIQNVLTAAGYVVTGGTDPGMLMQLAAAESRPVDAALIDAGWLTPQTSAEWVESMFSARNVPSAILKGDAKRSRAAIDRLLLGA